MKKLGFSFAPILLATTLAATPAAADDIEQSLELALEAYRAGDLKLAKEEIDFAAQLIAQKRAGALADFLPEPMEGWTRRDDSAGAQAAGAFGGQTASATYQKDGQRVEVQLMANNQMVSAMAGMFGNATLMGSMGEVRRIGRQKVVVTNSGEVQTLVDNRIMVNVRGNASVEEKIAYFEAIDVRALEDF